jgi:hypothetical protein
MKDALDIATYLILAALVVLIVMNASKFATAVQSLSNAGNSTLSILSGQNYK